MINAFIIQDGNILYSVIINNEINIFDMPSVQLSARLLEHDEVFDKLKKIKNYTVQAEIIVLGDVHSVFQAPPLYELLNATIDYPSD